MKLDVKHLKPTPILSKNQHFKFGYQRKGTFQPFSFREEPTDRWHVEYGRCERQPGNFRQECLQAARDIADSTNLPIQVLFSGGIDSEIALRSFHEAGIPCQAMILRFKNDLNLHDYSWAVITCETLGIPYKLIDLDILEFWNGKALEYADATQCVSPQLLSTMWLVDQCDGYCLLGSGENYIVKHRPETCDFDHGPYLRSQWLLFEKEKIASWYRHFIWRGREGCPGFFQYSPELMLSWFLDPIAITLWNDDFPRKYDSSSIKYGLYREHFDLMPRPKYTGFEKIKNEDRIFREKLVARFPDSNQVSAVPVPTVVRALSPDPEVFPARYIYREFENPEWGTRFRWEDTRTPGQTYASEGIFLETPPVS